MSDFEAKISDLGGSQRDELEDMTADLINQLKYLRRHHRFLELWREKGYRDFTELELYLISQSKLDPSTFTYVMGRVSRCYQDTYDIFYDEEIGGSVGEFINKKERRDYREYLGQHLEEVFPDGLYWVTEELSANEYYHGFNNYNANLQSKLDDMGGIELLDSVPQKCERVAEQYEAAIQERDAYKTDGGYTEIESAVYDAIWLVGCGIAITYDGATLNPLSVGMSLMGLAAYAQARE